MSDIALYYPHLVMRDETWLKAALLHWPRIARMVPKAPNWNRRPRSLGDPDRANHAHAGWSGEAMRLLRDDGCLLDVGIPPSIVPEFLSAVENHQQMLERRYGVARILGEAPRGGRTGNLSPSGLRRCSELSWLAYDKMTWELKRELVRAGLAVEDYPWLGVHPKLASIYMCAVAERLGRRERMAAVTDEPSLHAALNDWTLDTLTRALLDDVPADILSTATTEEIGRLFTLVAVETVVPGGLENIPLERIMAVRQEILPEMYAYRRYLHTLADTFGDLATVTDQGVLRGHLEILVRGEVQPRIADLERRLRLLGFQPVRAVLGMKALAPSALMAAVANQTGLPGSITAAGAVAGCLVGAAVESRQQSRQASNESTDTYLLALKRELSPRGCVMRGRSLLARGRRWRASS